MADDAALETRPSNPLAQYGPALAAYVLPFSLILYLALRGGGYDAITRDEVGVAIWWIVGIAAVLGLAPSAGLSRSGMWLLGALLAFAAWTAAALIWTESSERTVIEIGRVASYVGIFLVALIIQGRDGLKRTVSSVAAAIAVIGVLALLSRLHPAWFPENDASRILANIRGRLSYPLNYWNGLAALLSIGVPLLLVVATSALRTWTRVLAAAAIPALLLATFYTISRGGPIELAVAVVTLFALHPRRLALLPTTLVCAVGATILIAAATQRDALADGFDGALASHQGNEMLAATAVVCVATGLLQAAIAISAKRGLGPRPRISRTGAATAFAIAAAIVVIAAIGLGVPGKLGDRWQEFKQPGGPANNATTDRFTSASGNGRYQWWASTLHANATAPIVGIGPGTWEYWWARTGDVPGFVRDAHSLYLETLAELGIVGFLLIISFVGGVLVVGIRRALRAPPERRSVLAAAVAGCATFAIATMIDWSWELAVLPATFLLLAASVLGRDPVDEPTRAPGFPAGAPRLLPRVATVTLAVVALLAIGIPLLGMTAVRASQADARSGRLDQALDEAKTAEKWQPYAATPHLQEALVLELIAGQAGGGASDDMTAAIAAATEATRNEPTNWRTWFVLSRLQSKAGEAAESAASYDQAKSLNPRSPLFADG